MGKKKSSKTGLLKSLQKMLGSTKDKSRRGAKAPLKPLHGRNSDLFAPYLPPRVDLDQLLHPSKKRNSPIPHQFSTGTVLVSQRHGVKCLLLDVVEGVDLAMLKQICRRKLTDNRFAYLPLGTMVIKDAVAHQGRDFIARLGKGTVLLSPGGHPNGYLLDEIALPLRKELGSNGQYMPLTEVSSKRNLQKLVNLPDSFFLLKEDLLHTPEAPAMTVEKGSLVISRGGTLTGLMLEDVQLPLRKSVVDLTALFALKTTYESFPLDMLLDQARTSGKEIPIERGTFLFSSYGKVYFVWREGVTASESTLKTWSISATIVDPNILEVSVTYSNSIGGPGQVITQDEINYLRDVFKTAGSTNIYRQTLLLENNAFFKFVQDIPYAHTGKFRSFLHKGLMIQLNTFRKGTFSVELGGSRIEVTDKDLVQIRKHLQAEGRILIKIGTLLRISDERAGDWIYRAINNVFYPYETLTRARMEEFIPESITFDHRAERQSTLIGPQEDPHDDDIGSSGDPLGDLVALINNELGKERTVFIIDGTLFFFKKRLYRVNEELVFRPQHHSKLDVRDMEGLEADWKIHAVVEDQFEDSDDLPPEDFSDDDEDLEDLPFDTSVRR